MSHAAFPFDGKLYPSSAKKFAELVFFVHHFEGDRKSVHRHVDLVNELGYDAFAFTLDRPRPQHLMPITPEGKMGWKHYYAEQIEQLLNLLPGQKIVFSFSNPSAGAIECLAHRNCHDIKALICDSGPSANLGLSAFRLAKKYFIERRIKKAIYTGALIWSWSPNFHHDLHKELNIFPPNFPVLSIRGWKDELISPADIDQVFEPHAQLQWQKLSLPEAHHLDGLKLFPKEYLAGLRPFLNEVSR